jgi:hypothetical protein
MGAERDGVGKTVFGGGANAQLTASHRPNYNAIAKTTHLTTTLHITVVSQCCKPQPSHLFKDTERKKKFDQVILESKYREPNI